MKMINKVAQVLSVCSSLVLLSACQNIYLTQPDEQRSNQISNEHSFKQAVASEEQHKSNRYFEFVYTGDILPIGVIKTIEGKEIDMQKVGKKKLVILFATWCSDSNRLLNAMNSSPLLNDDTVEVIAIARQEDKETVKAWQQAHNIKTPLAVDVDRTIYKKFASGGIPRIITVGENNKIIKMNLAEGNEQLSQIVW